MAEIGRGGGGGRGSTRREEILGVAVDLATGEGLSALTIGSLAAAADMSKSGLFAHFGSKEELQLAVVARAARDFDRAVFAPAAETEAGLPRLRALVDAWFTYVDEIDYRGGCFFDTASREFGSQPGLVRDGLADLCGKWRSALREQARLAVRLGELRGDTDADLLAFRLHAYAGEANWARELLGDPDAFEQARRAVVATLDESVAALVSDR
jgi:AcrR family transcriptional regulator